MVITVLGHKHKAVNGTPNHSNPNCLSCKIIFMIQFYFIIAILTSLVRESDVILSDVSHNIHFILPETVNCQGKI